MLIRTNLKESTRKDLNALKINEILGDYIGLLCNTNFMKYSLILGAGMGFFFAFATAGPFILIKQHGLSTEYFGYYQGIMVITYIAGSIVTARLAKNRPPIHLYLWGWNFTTVCYHHRQLVFWGAAALLVKRER